LQIKQYLTMFNLQNRGSYVLAFSKTYANR
jgi:hypothetical protein